MKKFLLTLGLITCITTSSFARRPSEYSQGYHNGYHAGYDAGKDDKQEDIIKGVFITGLIVFIVVAICDMVSDNNRR